ncbi:glycosyltransferase family 2 protein [Candidatus Peregrinibacteria bacterium]|nr:glycosyltransferase family 2 protein [Candidatus Peregrinibacteria bacterium]
MPLVSDTVGRDRRVSAIILNYRSPRDTLGCIRALLAQTIADRIEIIVVDNHSDDESIGWIRNQFKGNAKVKIVESAMNRGYGQGNELGIRGARGKYFLIINPDNQLEPTGLEKMVAKMENDPGIGILAPKLVHPDGTIRPSFRKFPSMPDVFIKRTFLITFFPERVDRYLEKETDSSVTRDVDWVVGACFLIRKDFFQALGGFDPHFFLFFEDMDLCRRTWTAGKRVVYFPDVVAGDRKGRLSEGGILSLFTKKTVRIHLKSALWYFWKWKGLRVPK